MAEFQEDAGVYPLMVALAACLCTTITERGLPEPCFCGVTAGALVSGEYCEGCGGPGCTNGKAWVRLAREYPSTNFPVEDELTECDAPRAWLLEMGVARCAPVVATDGVISGFAPDVGQWLAATRLQMADKEAMRAAVLCCLGDRGRDWAVGAYEPFGPEGMCVGGTLAVRVPESLGFEYGPALGI